MPVLQGIIGLLYGSITRAGRHFASEEYRGGTAGESLGGRRQFRDLAGHPIPHFDAITGLACMFPSEWRSRAEHLSFALSVELINEIKKADTVPLGVPFYNYGPPAPSRPGSTT